MGLISESDFLHGWHCSRLVRFFNCTHAIAISVQAADLLFSWNGCGEEVLVQGGVLSLWLQAKSEGQRRIARRKEHFDHEAKATPTPSPSPTPPSRATPKRTRCRNPQSPNGTIPPSRRRSPPSRSLGHTGRMLVEHDHAQDGSRGRRACDSGDCKTSTPCHNDADDNDNRGKRAKVHARRAKFQEVALYWQLAMRT